MNLFTDRPAWEAGTTGPYTSETFEDLSQVTAGAIIGAPAPFGPATSNAAVLPGEIVNGLEFSDVPLNDADGGSADGLIACGSGCAGTALPSKVVCHNTFVDSLRVDFTDGDVTAFGVDIGALFGNTDNGTLSVFDAADHEFITVDLTLVPDDMSQFVGITSVSTLIAYFIFEVEEVGGSNVSCVDNLSFSSETIVALEPGVPVEFVDDYVLDAAYPNPFNPQSTVRFAIRETGPVSLTLYNTLGQQVRTLFEGTAASGQVVTATINGDGLASGVYLIELRGENFVGTRSVTLLK